MITITEALIQRFPQGNEWARQALTALGGGIEPHTMVHALAPGWMRRGSGPDAELVDTLFILTGDHLGLGQTVAGVGGPHWIPTTSIQALDAIDDAPYPLETIEMALLDGTELCVGWSEEFSSALVDLLLRQLNDDAGAPPESMPSELVDPSSVQPDASSLDDLAPSAWVERPIAPGSPAVEPWSPTGAAAVPSAGEASTPQPSMPEPPATQFALGSMSGIGNTLRATEPEADQADQAFSVQSAEQRVHPESNPALTHLDDAPPPGLAPMFGSRVRTGGADQAPEHAPADGAIAPAAVDLTEGRLPDESWVTATALDAPPAPPMDTAFRPLDHGATEASTQPPPGASTGFAESGSVPPGMVAPDMVPPTMTAPGSPTRDPAKGFAPGATAATPARPGPWQSHAVQWPETLKSVSYLGGHPGHPRRRKNGTMVFSPAGIDINGSGFQSWSMHIDWSYIDRLEVFGADEVMFTEHIKVDGNSSAVVVQILDGTKLFFEVRLRRPPSLRATLAPMLALVEDIRVDRTTF